MSSSGQSIAAAFTPLDRLSPIELQQIANADPYMAGYASRAVGLPLDSRACHSWQCGWNDAAEDDRQGFAMDNSPKFHVGQRVHVIREIGRNSKIAEIKHFHSGMCGYILADGGWFGAKELELDRFQLQQQPATVSAKSQIRQPTCPSA